MPAKTLLPDNLHELNNLRGEISEFINHYTECKFQNNPWKHLDDTSPNIGEINALLINLVHISNSLENRSNSFYPENLEWITEHRWLDSHYPSFLSGELHLIHQSFKQLSIDTKKLKDWLTPHYVETILKTVRAGNVAVDYKNLQDFSGTINQVLHIKKIYMKLILLGFYMKI